MTYPIRIQNEKYNNKVYMEFQGNKLIGELQQEFNAHFPFLRIEFYRQRSKEEKPGNEKLNVGQKLQSLNGSTSKISVQIDENDRITSLKEQFNKFGIGVLIFRKAGRVWVETNLTDDWTLDRQNAEGELFSRK